MSDDKELNPSDMLVRALVRLHSQLGKRKTKDEEDFLQEKLAEDRFARKWLVDVCEKQVC
jgi:hypothetical protein